MISWLIYYSVVKHQNWWYWAHIWSLCMLIFGDKNTQRQKSLNISSIWDNLYDIMNRKWIEVSFWQTYMHFTPHTYYRYKPLRSVTLLQRTFCWLNVSTDWHSLWLVQITPSQPHLHTVTVAGPTKCEENIL